MLSASRNFELDIVLPGCVGDLRQLSRARALQRFGAQRSLSGYEDEMPKNQPHRRFSTLVPVHTPYRNLDNVFWFVIGRSLQCHGFKHRVSQPGA